MQDKMLYSTEERINKLNDMIEGAAVVEVFIRHEDEHVIGVGFPDVEDLEDLSHALKVLFRTWGGFEYNEIHTVGFHKSEEDYQDAEADEWLDLSFVKKSE